MVVLVLSVIGFSSFFRGKMFYLFSYHELFCVYKNFKKNLVLSEIGGLLSIDRFADIRYLIRYNSNFLSYL
ncbi:MAG: hypothetical protein A2V65_00795 [Deltaproteobacteria bacterium RBG_13_49_15]|nr:MAG: hypothetical protein A2V65_00795 [Deltaproteobacteria bacterium RBG_13_49_15]